MARFQFSLWRVLLLLTVGAIFARLHRDTLAGTLFVFVLLYGSAIAGLCAGGAAGRFMGGSRSEMIGQCLGALIGMAIVFPLIMFMLPDAYYPDF